RHHRPTSRRCRGVRTDAVHQGHRQRPRAVRLARTSRRALRQHYTRRRTVDLRAPAALHRRAVGRRVSRRRLSARRCGALYPSAEAEDRRRRGAEGMMAVRTPTRGGRWLAMMFVVTIALVAVPTLAQAAQPLPQATQSAEAHPETGEQIQMALVRLPLA